jgi:acetate kinase
MGEHAPQARARICDPLGHLGFVLDAKAIQANGTRISAARSKPVLRIAADEEAVREMIEDALARSKGIDGR